MLFWIVKTMMLASSTASPEEAGLKPFVYNKAKRFLKNYKQKELNKILLDITSVIYKARKVGEPTTHALERFVLSI